MKFCVRCKRTSRPVQRVSQTKRGREQNFSISISFVMHANAEPPAYIKLRIVVWGPCVCVKHLYILRLLISLRYCIKCFSLELSICLFIHVFRCSLFFSPLSACVCIYVWVIFGSSIWKGMNQCKRDGEVRNNVHEGCCVNRKQLSLWKYIYAFINATKFISVFITFFFASYDVSIEYWVYWWWWCWICCCP